jgi:integrase
VSAQRGQVFRAPAGSWAIRYYDASGQRRQRNGFRTRSEARAALDEALRRVRLGPLFRPRVTLRELGDAYLEQYEAAPSSMSWLRYNLETVCRRLGDEPIGQLSAQQVGAWRASLPEPRRHPAHRALRQVLEAAVRWKWIEENVAALVKNPAPRLGEIDPFTSWDEIDAIAGELAGIEGVLVSFLAGTGVRPEEAFGAEWRDVDLDRRVLTVRRAFAKGGLKDYGKTERSRRRVPLRARSVAALAQLEHRRGILFPNSAGKRIDINNFRHRGWTPALQAAGVAHRRIYDLRHTYATWSLAAGIDIFTLSRRMGTSVAMIDRTYGHLAAGADDYERDLLDAFDVGRSGSDGRRVGAGSVRTERETG